MQHIAAQILNFAQDKIVSGLDWELVQGQGLVGFNLEVSGVVCLALKLLGSSWVVLAHCGFRRLREMSAWLAPPHLKLPPIRSICKGISFTGVAEVGREGCQGIWSEGREGGRQVQSKWFPVTCRLLWLEPSVFFRLLLFSSYIHLKKLVGASRPDKDIW